MHEDMENKLKDILSNIRHCAATTDEWTSRANDHYLTVTCHFLTNDFQMKSAVLSTDKLQNDQDQTTERIASSLHKILFEWGVESKVSAIVTDNAASMIKACVILQKRLMPCFAHTLNLIMQDQLENIKPIIAKLEMLQNEISALSKNLNPCSDSNNDPPIHETQEDTALFSFMKAKLEKKK
ncbi:hypothetical protein ACLKA6_014000 [Drosophila palustris]